MASELLCDRPGCRRIAKRWTITGPDGTETVCVCGVDANKPLRQLWELGRRTREASEEARRGRAALTKARMGELVDRGPSRSRR